MHARSAIQSGIAASDGDSSRAVKSNRIAAKKRSFRAGDFYLPVAALNAVADEAHKPRIGDLNYQPGSGIEDPVFRHLTLALLPALERPEETSRLFVDHVTDAVPVHVAHVYCGLDVISRPSHGVLAPWHERRALDILAASLEGNVPPRTLAQELGLSVGH